MVEILILNLNINTNLLSLIPKLCLIYNFKFS